MKRIIFILILILTLIFLYGRFIETDNFNIKEYTIHNESISDSFKELKIVHFSDILYKQDTKKLEKLKKEINDLSADILIFTGDLFDSDYTYSDEDYNNLKDFLSNLNADYKYTVYGENDEKNLDKFKDIMYDSNFKLLDNSSTLFFYKDVTPIKIIGYTNSSVDFNTLLESDVPYNYTLLITHKPDNIELLSNYNIDTVISGHSLGGIINIPYYGGLIKMDGSNTYINDYYKVNNTDLYISNGIGYKLFEFRLFNAPSINVYRFDN